MQLKLKSFNMNCLFMSFYPVLGLCFRISLDLFKGILQQYTCYLTRKIFGFEQTCRPMYEILVTGPLGNSECAGDCLFSANLCKRALGVTADVIVEATRNAGILTINASEDFQ